VANPIKRCQFEEFGTLPLQIQPVLRQRAQAEVSIRQAEVFHKIV